jgi:hypothetical protein
MVSLVRPTSTLALAFLLGSNSALANEREPLTIDSTISFRTFERLRFGDGLQPLPSPDGTRYALLERWGDAAQNTLHYALSVFVPSGSGLFDQHLVSMVERDDESLGIESVHWVSPNIIAFIERLDDNRGKIISYNLATRSRTSTDTGLENVTRFRFNEDGSGIVVRERTLPQKKSAPAIFVADQPEVSFYEAYYGNGAVTVEDVYVRKANGEMLPVELDPGEEVLRFRYQATPVLLSPDGRWALLQTGYRNGSQPENWSKHYQTSISTALYGSYRIVNLKTGSTHRLLDRPAYYGGAIWRPDSRSVITGSMYAERGQGFRSEILDVDLYGRTKQIAAAEMRSVLWDRFDPTTRMPTGSVLTSGESPAVTLMRCRTGLCVVPLKSYLGTPMKPTVTVSESYNSAPRLVSLISGKVVWSYDPNKMINWSSSGRLQEIAIPRRTGGSLSIGVFWPPAFDRSKTYPIIVQTHGWSRKSFMVNGPLDANEVGRILSAHGVIVLQLPDIQPERGEGQAFMELVEDALDEMSRLGCLDINKLGIQGFSRTGFGVRYSLVNSRYRFKAASILDATDGGYFEYIGASSRSPETRAFIANLNGGAADPDAVAKWATTTPSFRIADGGAAILLINSAAGPSGGRETYIRMRSAGKPVELVLLPKAGHPPKLPAQRIVSQGLTADWFLYWLQEKRDHSPEKMGQYARWDAMRSWKADTAP